MNMDQVNPLEQMEIKPAEEANDTLAVVECNQDTVQRSVQVERTAPHSTSLVSDALSKDDHSPPTRPLDDIVAQTTSIVAMTDTNDAASDKSTLSHLQQEQQYCGDSTVEQPPEIPVPVLPPSSTTTATLATDDLNFPYVSDVFGCEDALEALAAENDALDQANSLEELPGASLVPSSDQKDMNINGGDIEMERKIAFSGKRKYVSSLDWDSDDALIVKHSKGGSSKRKHFDKAFNGTTTDGGGESDENASQNDHKLDECYKKGQRVYCKWPENDNYYWGTITKVYGDGPYHYKIRFDDNDIRWNVPAKDFYLEDDPIMIEADIKDPMSVTSGSSKKNYKKGSPKTYKRKNKKFHRLSKSSATNKLEKAAGEKTRGPKTSSPPSGENRTVGGKMSLKKSKKNELTRPLSSEKDQGFRCYARFSNNKWYWGTIFFAAKVGSTIRYAVLFDDSDMVTGLGENDVCSEMEYWMSTNLEPPQPPKARSSPVYKPWDLRELYASRCRECCMCKLDDCGRCSPCLDNQANTTLHKLCCLFKICKEIPAAVKAQPVPTLQDFCFYIDEPNTLIKKSIELWPQIAGLKVSVTIDKKVEIFDSMESAVKARFPTQDPAPLCVELYENQLGLDLSIPVDHELIGKPFCREWTDSTGQHRWVSGIITGCIQESPGQTNRKFKLQYSRTTRKMGNLANKIDGFVPAFEKVSEEDALGAYLAYGRLSPYNPLETCPAISGPLPCHWHVPAMTFQERGADEIPHLVLRIFRFELRLEAKRSSIPNAGLGLWVNCEATVPELCAEPYFELPPGALVDLGLYAPVRQSDKKKGIIATLKSFIHNWECDSWNFDAHESAHVWDSCTVFDITNDWTGELHSDAKRNTLVYANETSEGELPNLVAKHDPLGCVHYLLGHTDRARGPLRLPLGEDIELKVDYGPIYDKVRARKGYLKASKPELKKMQEEIERDDPEFIDNIRDYNVIQLDESISFLEHLFLTGQTSIENWKVARAFLAASAIGQRLVKIKQEFEGVDIHSDEVSFCDGGYELLDKNNCVPRVHMLLDEIRARFRRDVELKNILVSNERYLKILSQLLNIEDTHAIAKVLSAEELVKKLIYATYC